MSSEVPTTTTDHEFGALNTLLLVVILGLCILSAYLIKQNSFYYLPESAAAVVVGLIVGGLARLSSTSAEELEFLTFEPEIFFFLLLPPIIFEAAYSLKVKDFFANFWTISLYAVFGTIISTIVISVLVYGLGVISYVNIDISSPVEALLFGSLISAVDPVATLSILGKAELNCDPLLYSLVFGESVLNDAVSIVLFKTFLSFYKSGNKFNSHAVLSMFISFTGVSMGSIFIGVVMGLICSYTCKHTNLRKYPEYEISMLFLFGYGSFSLSESLDLSGIMSLFFCGIVLSHYNISNLSPTSQVTSHNIFKSLTVLAEFFVFLYIGMGLFTGKFKRWHFGFFVLTMMFCLLGRLLNTFPLSFVANLCRKKTIPLGMQSIIWFAGLRGAISFALSLNMPGPHKDLYVTTTLSIVIFTTIICGGLTEPMLKRMNMKNTNNRNESISDSGTMTYELMSGLEDSGSDSDASVIESLATETIDKSRKETLGRQSPRTLFQRFDAEYLSPLFGGPQQGESIGDRDLLVEMSTTKIISEKKSFPHRRAVMEGKYHPPTPDRSKENASK